MSDDDTESVFDNPQFFLITTKDEYAPPPSSSSSSSSWMFDTSDKKRRELTLECKHCGRPTQILFFQAGCTHECTLSVYWKRSETLYDFVYNEISKFPVYKLTSSAPLHMPDRMDDESIEDFWDRQRMTLYEETDRRREQMMQCLRESTVISSEHLPTKTQKIKN